MTTKSIMVTYPDFQALPKGVKRMLLASEDFYFGEVRPPCIQGAALKTALWGTNAMPVGLPAWSGGTPAGTLCRQDRV